MDESAELSGLLGNLRTIQPSSPRLIWYGPDGERVELSGRVLENWIAKTSNLLVDELDAEPGMRVGLQLPVHWKFVVWAAACWQVGAVAVTGPAAEAADVVVSSSPHAQAHGDAVLVLVALGALDMRWNGPLPDGAVDFAAEVRMHGDVFPDGQPPSTGPVLETDGGSYSLADLLGQAIRTPDGGTPAGGVVLVPAGCTPTAAIGAVLRSWSSGGSVVLVHPEVEVTDRLLSSERVTARLEA